MRIDLDAARAARREAQGEAPVVVIDGKELKLPVELPFEVAEGLSAFSDEAIRLDPAGSATALHRVLGLLLGPAHDEFMAASPSINDVMMLLDGLVKSYGLEDLGESRASAASS